MLTVGVEDLLSEAVARKLLTEVGFDANASQFIIERGAGDLRKHLSRYLSSGARRLTFVLTDLDNVECAPALLRKWMVGKSLPSTFILRVAVREIESWVLADRIGMHRFFRLPLRRLPNDTDALEDPKAELLTLMSGASVQVRKGLVRTEAGKAFRGVLYNQKLREFVVREWSSDRASDQSGSLRKAKRALTLAYASFVDPTIH